MEFEKIKVIFGISVLKLTLGQNFIEIGAVSENNRIWNNRTKESNFEQ